MEIQTTKLPRKQIIRHTLKRLMIFMAVFGPATITAMADNDASGVATYSVAGAKLGYPILFALGIITILLGITQEMGMRLTLVTRRGLADMIREHFGIKVALVIFIALIVANIGTIIGDMSAIRTTSAMLNLPVIPALVVMVVGIFIFVTKGNYKLTQTVMLISSLFYLTYVFSAVKAKPDWGMALSNLIYPHGVDFTREYMRNYLIIGLGVLGTTITPWGQFFVSSFAFDKNIEERNLKYSQFETYLGAFLTDFFSFFMIVATAATLFVNNIPLVSGEQAALAIQPFAGKLAGTLFALGILNAGFMGIVIVSLSTAYAFSEFFGLPGSLNASFKKGRAFYAIFLSQLLIAAVVVSFPNVDLFQVAIISQGINATMLPLVFYYLIRLTNDKTIMNGHANNRFQRVFVSIATVLIFFASIAAWSASLLQR
jgi:Mn2+/Fe2+ NRAMP family transporter